MSLAAALTLAGLSSAMCLVLGFALGAWVAKDNGPPTVYHIGIEGIQEAEPRYNSRSEKR